MAWMVRLAWVPTSPALSADDSAASPEPTLERAPPWSRRTFEPSSKKALLHSSLYGSAAASGSGGFFFLVGFFSFSGLPAYGPPQPAAIGAAAAPETAKAIASAIPRNRVVMPGPTIRPAPAWGQR